MEVHVPIDVREGAEVLVAVGAAVDGPAVGENDRFADILALHWCAYHIKPAAK